MQAGAGKTHTLGNTEPSAIGMIPRCVAEIFKTASSDPFNAYTVTMSYIQVRCGGVHFFSCLLNGQPGVPGYQPVTW
jgi:hypothetical protein